MSHSQNPSPLPPPALSAQPAQDLAALAASLTQAATALQALSAAPAPHAADGKTSPDAEACCYYLPPAVMRKEREMLRYYKVADFPSLLDEAYGLMCGIVKLMKGTSPRTHLKGETVIYLGQSLERSLALIRRMRDVYQQVQRSPVQ